MINLITDVFLAISELARQQALYGTEEKYNKLYKLRCDLHQYEENYNDMLKFIKAVASMDWNNQYYIGGKARKLLNEMVEIDG